MKRYKYLKSWIWTQVKRKKQKRRVFSWWIWSYVASSLPLTRWIDKIAKIATKKSLTATSWWSQTEGKRTERLAKLKTSKWWEWTEEMKANNASKRVGTKTIAETRRLSQWRKVSILFVLVVGEGRRSPKKVKDQTRGKELWRGDRRLRSSERPNMKRKKVDQGSQKRERRGG